MAKLIILILLLSLNLKVEAAIDHLREAQKWVNRVYSLIYSVGCKHTSNPARKLGDIKIRREINCAASASITYQRAGIIDEGKLVSHTAAVSKNVNIIKHYDVSDLQQSLKLSVKNYGNLKKGTCDLVKVMAKYNDMPSWLKQKGIMYIQDSNICISAGDKKIYSCNSTGKTYSKNGVDPLRSSGYTFNSPILWAVVPRSNGKSNVDSNTKLKHLPC